MKIGILGYGNLGRGVEFAVKENSDTELAAVFTRRNPADVKIQTENVPVVKVDDAANWQDKIDVMIFDTHAKIPEHFAAVDNVAKSSNHVAIISVGWDPGLFSLARVYSNAILPGGNDYTFWGKGVSQGHSDAIRRISGVKNAKQYTIPVEAALDAVRAGKNPELSTRQKHLRECFVVLEDGVQ